MNSSTHWLHSGFPHLLGMVSPQEMWVSPRWPALKPGLSSSLFLQETKATRGPYRHGAPDHRALNMEAGSVSPC